MQGHVEKLRSKDCAICSRNFNLLATEGLRRYRAVPMYIA